MKIIDLSIPIEDGLPSDPPIQIPKIQYCNHKDTAEQMAGFFKGCTVEDLPEGNGWGIEFLQVCTHSGTHVDAPYHYYPTIDGGCFGLFFAVFRSTRRFQMAAFLHSLHRFQAA